MTLSIRSLEKLIVDRAEQRTRGGRQPLRTLEYDLRLAAPDGSGRLEYSELNAALRRALARKEEKAKSKRAGGKK